MTHSRLLAARFAWCLVGTIAAYVIFTTVSLQHASALRSIQATSIIECNGLRLVAAEATTWGTTVRTIWWQPQQIDDLRWSEWTLMRSPRVQIAYSLDLARPAYEKPRRDCGCQPSDLLALSQLRAPPPVVQEFHVGWPFPYLYWIEYWNAETSDFRPLRSASSLGPISPLRIHIWSGVIGFMIVFITILAACESCRFVATKILEHKRYITFN